MSCRFKSFSKQARFDDLCEAVRYCTLCPELIQRTKVLSAKNGNINAKILFVAEAPGRLGADKTGIPLFGDATGNNFELLLGNIGWHRNDIFITNALLCNPRDGNGNNASPRSAQVKNCFSYLKMTLELIQPEVVVPLGIVALNSLGNISPHNLKLKQNVGEFVPWSGRKLFPLYHPGPRALIHRSRAKQRADFFALAKLVDPTTGIKKSPPKTKSQATDQVDYKAFHQLILTIVQHMGRVSHFKLTKLLYLVDLKCIEAFGESLTGEIYLRQAEGPWPPTLQKELPKLEGNELSKRFVRDVLIFSGGPSPRFEARFDDKALQIIVETLDRYGNLTNAKLKTSVYSTRPMKYILRQENSGRDMRNAPVIYKNETAPDLDSM